MCPRLLVHYQMLCGTWTLRHARSTCPQVASITLPVPSELLILLKYFWRGGPWSTPKLPS